MTVLGVSGCTALLVTGFGIQDSVNAIMGKQFEEIFLYDGLALLNMDKERERKSWRFLEERRRSGALWGFLK